MNKNPCVPFFAIGPDNALKHLNRSVKVTGGLVGITLNPSARAKFFLIAPELVRLANQAKDMEGVTHEIRGKHHNLTAAVVSREEKNITKLYILRFWKLSTCVIPSPQCAFQTWSSFYIRGPFLESPEKPFVKLLTAYFGEPIF